MGAFSRRDIAQGAKGPKPPSTTTTTPMEQQTIVLKSSIAGSEELLRRTIAIPKASISLADFKAIVEGIHRLNQPFSLSWTDDDQDTIAILTDEDVAEALGTTLSLPKPVLRLSLKPANRITRQLPGDGSNAPRRDEALAGQPDWDTYGAGRSFDRRCSQGRLGGSAMDRVVPPERCRR